MVLGSVWYTPFSRGNNVKGFDMSTQGARKVIRFMAWMSIAAGFIFSLCVLIASRRGTLFPRVVSGTDIVETFVGVSGVVFVVQVFFLLIFRKYQFGMFRWLRILVGVVALGVAATAIQSDMTYSTRFMDMDRRIPDWPVFSVGFVIWFLGVAAPVCLALFAVEGAIRSARQLFREAREARKEMTGK